VGVSYATRAASRRVALIGDSYTFGLEVPFKHSWGHVLENRLGPDVQVLNFGVDGYGVDQAYLRYIRDVRPWRPDIVVFGFIDHDLHRTMSVYTFLSFPGWALPFAKPRFVMNAGKLELINHPIPGPHTILSYASLAELPFLDYEPGYDAGEWEWSVIYHSHLVRFLLSRFPRFRAPSPEVSEHAVKSVSTEIFTSFAEIARKDGAVPLVVYFPSRSDFGGGNRHIKNAVVEELTRKGIEYRDLTDCLKRVDPGKRFLEGRSHYSEAANKTVALCLKGALVSLFER
jgi:hypothetical protein